MFGNVESVGLGTEEVLQKMHTSFKLNDSTAKRKAAFFGGMLRDDHGAKYF